MIFFFFFQAEDGIRDLTVTGVQTCALPISLLVLNSSHCEALASQGRIQDQERPASRSGNAPISGATMGRRSEEHTSELQSQSNLVCRLLLEKKKKKKMIINAFVRITTLLAR